MKDIKFNIKDTWDFLTESGAGRYILFATVTFLFPFILILTAVINIWVKDQALHY